MKKLISIILLLIVCMTAVCSAEDVDLSGYTLDQLIALRQKITMAMWETEEWQEVRVPMGIYQVGKDIPAGKWTVRCAVDKYSVITFGNKLSPGETDLDIFGTKYGRDFVTSPDYKYFEKGKDRTEYTFSVENGDYILIERCDVIFTPFAGNPDLGFK